MASNMFVYQLLRSLLCFKCSDLLSVSGRVSQQAYELLMNCLSVRVILRANWIMTPLSGSIRWTLGHAIRRLHRNREPLAILHVLHHMTGRNSCFLHTRTPLVAQHALTVAAALNAPRRAALQSG